MRSYIQFVLFFLIGISPLFGQLFNDNFGTGFQSIDGVLWDCKSASPSFNTSVGACSGTGDYGASLSNGQYLTSQSFFVPGPGYSLTFESSFNNTTGNPIVQVGTGGGFCWSVMTWTTIATINQSPSCEEVCISLDPYAGQTIYLKFLAGTSFTSWSLDEVLVDLGGCGGGGSGANYKWADNFNDNDLVLDYPGNDGDEGCPSCGPWVLGGGATLNLVPAGGWNGSSNKTEAFPGGMANVYYVKLDRNEYIESPVLDMSSMESVKISFHVKESSIGTGGGDSWTFSDYLKLQIWDGSSWVTVADDIRDFTDAALPFNYYCFSAYKSISSPGNHYFSSTPNVESSWFHSSFKFRVIFEGGFSGSPFAWVDDFTFRADSDGYSTMIPCGVSFWNEPEAGSYGQDLGVTGNNNAEKGVELELDNAINIPPIWSSEADDGDTITQVFGGGESERVVFCAISEHEIDFGYGKVQFYAPDIGWNTTSMSKDNNYTGPGWKYYAVEYISCDLVGSGIAEPTNDYRYYFNFDYGLSGFIPAFYHLNSTGQEIGGGATSSFEAFNAPDVLSTDECGTIIMALETLFLEASSSDNNVKLWWEFEKGWNSFDLLESNNGEDFNLVSTFEEVNSQTYLEFTVETFEKEVFYKLIGINDVGEIIESNRIKISRISDSDWQVFLSYTSSNDPVLNLNQGEKGELQTKLYNSTGKLIKLERHQIKSRNEVIPLIETGFSSGLYFLGVEFKGKTEFLKLILK